MKVLCVVGGIFILIAIVIVYLKFVFIKNISIAKTIKDVKILKLSLVSDSQIELDINVSITNGNPISIPVRYLSFEVYNGTTLLAKSADTPADKKPITIKGNGITTFEEDIQITVNSTNLTFFENYLSGNTASLTINVLANVAGININLSGLNANIKKKPKTTTK